MERKTKLTVVNAVFITLFVCLCLYFIFDNGDDLVYIVITAFTILVALFGITWRLFLGEKLIPFSLFNKNGEGNSLINMMRVLLICGGISFNFIFIFDLLAHKYKFLLLEMISIGFITDKGFHLFHPLGLIIILISIFLISRKLYKYLFFSTKDKIGIMEAIIKNEKKMIYVHDFDFYDKEFVMAVVTQNGNALKYTNEFQSNKEIVLAAIKQNKNAFKHASEWLQSDDEFSKLVSVLQMQ